MTFSPDSDEEMETVSVGQARRPAVRESLSNGDLVVDPEESDLAVGPSKPKVVSNVAPAPTDGNRCQ